MAQCFLLMAWLAGRSWQSGSRPIKNFGKAMGMTFPVWTPDATTKLTFMGLSQKLNSDPETVWPTIERLPVVKTDRF
jgi:hypothetical protein